MDRTRLSSERIPPAIGPYSQAIRAGGFIFCSGIVALSPDTGSLVEGDIEAEVRQALDNLSALLEDVGSSLEAVVKTTVFLADNQVHVSIPVPVQRYRNNHTQIHLKLLAHPGQLPACGISGMLSCSCVFEPGEFVNELATYQV